jgi:hypothetical protein
MDVQGGVGMGGSRRITAGRLRSRPSAALSGGWQSSVDMSAGGQLALLLGTTADFGDPSASDALLRRSRPRR